MFPQKAVRLIVPFGKDGATDTLARLIAARLAQRWGHEVVLEHQPGGGAVPGTLLAAQAGADGYTLLMGSSSTHSIAPALYGELPYDPVADFAPLSLLGWAPNLLLVAPGGPDSVGALLELARARPGALSYASAGYGQTIHLCAALLAELAGVELTHKPYPQGSMFGLQALMNGEVTLMCDNVLAALPFIRTGKVKPLAVAGAMRCPALPDLPTLEEAGLAGYAAEIWLGLLAPAGVPPEISAQIGHDIGIVLGQTDLVSELTGSGFMLDYQPGAEFAAEIMDNRAQWRAILQRCHIV